MSADWSSWTEKDIRRVLSTTYSMTFREILKALTCEPVGYAGVVLIRAVVRRLVREKKVTVRPRTMVGVRQGRGPDEFRRTR